VADVRLNALPVQMPVVQILVAEIGAELLIILVFKMLTRNKLQKLIVMTGLWAGLMLAGAAPISAQPSQGNNLCSVFPVLCNAISGNPGTINEGESRNFLFDRVNIVVSLIFVGIIFVAVTIIIRAGVKYIQSQGNAGQMEEAQKAIRNVFIGIGLLFIGIIGIILVLAFFGGWNFIGGNLTIDDVLKPN
jgi:magnesium-transporting ATPase (P-type)